MADESMERLAKLAGAATLALYVLGLIAVNGYLLSLNVSEFSLVRARFIYTGALLATFALLPYVAARHYLERFRREWGSDLPMGANEEALRELRERRRTALGLFIVGQLIGPGVFVVALGQLKYYSGARDYDPVVTGLAAYGLGLVLGLAVHLVVWITITRVDEADTAITRAIHIAFGCFMGLYVAAGFIAVFMAYLYPKIPEQFGGGRPSTVRFLVKNDAMSGVAALGLPFSHATHLSGDVLLLHEGTTSYVVRLPEGKIAQLKKDLIAAVITGQ